MRADSNASMMSTSAAPPRTPTPEEEELAALPWMIRLTILTLVSVLLGWIVEESRGILPIEVAWGLYVVAYVAGGYYSVQEAWASLLQRQFDVNMLMILAALGAAIVGHPLEGAVLMFLFSLSNTLETYAMGRTHASIQALIDMTPKTARVLRGEHEARHEVEVPVEEVAVDEHVMVRPGEQIPTDGVIVRGESAVNEASITGESLPVEKVAGMKVFAGTINGQGALEVRVTTAVADSTLARIVKVVSEAREQKAASQEFTDRVVGQYYAYAVVVMTLLAIIIPLVFLGWEFDRTLRQAMTLMVVASPCALVISIPAAFLSAMASAAREGVLFKGGAHLESAARVKVVAFDKTGTLTTGRPGVVAIIPLIDPQSAEHPLNTFDLVLRRGEYPPLPPDDMLGILDESQQRVLAIAAGIEHFSEHPLAQAVVRKAKEHGVPFAAATQFEALTGAGARATIDTTTVYIGRPTMFNSLSEHAMALIEEQQRQGRTVIALGDDHPWALLAIADTVREESKQVVADLKAIGIERVVLLTGDNRYVAEQLGHDLGVDEVRAELLPEDKVTAIRELQEQVGPVAMIGDGVNDAPALATAALGVAMGAVGTDVAMESADVMLMGDDLSKLPGMLRLARRARAIVTQNLTFAPAAMVILVIFALFGRIPLTIGVLGHEGGTLIVVANGLRLLMPWK